MCRSFEAPVLVLIDVLRDLQGVTSLFGFQMILRFQNVLVWKLLFLIHIWQSDQ